MHGIEEEKKNKSKQEKGKEKYADAVMQSVFLTVHVKSVGKMIMKNRVHRINISLIFERLEN